MTEQTRVLVTTDSAEEAERLARSVVADRLVADHSYDVPEVIVVPVVGGHAPYLAWVVDETRP